MSRDDTGVGRGALSVLLVIGLLIGLGALPAINIGGVELRQINILSEITETPQDPLTEQDLQIDLADFEIDIERVEASARGAREMLAMAEPEPQEPTEKIEKAPQQIAERSNQITPIEEFDSLSTSAMGRLYRRLSDSTKVTRIAVLGDSFIEGDILTQDLRETMQSRYGGRGAGFAPFDSPTSKYRGTVRSESSGWQTYNIMQRRNAPSTLTPHWFVSGWLSEATSDGAQSRLRLTSMREYNNQSGRVRLLFKSLEGSDLSVAVNGDERREYRVDGSEQLQQIIIEQDSINEIAFRIERGAEGFIGYGCCFEGDGSGGGGVVVDNFAIRSNNGQAVLWSDPATNAQFDALVGGYDLVVLQYGLNLLQSGVRNYSRYGEQIEKLIAFAQECFPRAAIVVWSVSDRSIKRDGAFVPMDEARDMAGYQRAAADSMSVAFWDTHRAMTMQGGMSRFVANRWAAKDYTHINSAGGRELGRAFADAIEESRLRWCPPPIETPHLEPMVRERVVIEGLHKTEMVWEI